MRLLGYAVVLAGVLVGRAWAAPIHDAVAGGQLDVVRAQVDEQAARVNEKSPRDGTPLQLAVAGDRREIAAYLLSKGADATVTDGAGNTLLHAAASPEMVALLLGAGLNVQAKNAAGATPLLTAAARGQADVVAALLAKGADAKAVDARGNTALLLAVQRDRPAVVQALLAQGANVAVKDSQENTLLHLARGPAVAALLLPRLDAKAKNALGETPLLSAVRQGWTEQVGWWLEHGAEATAVDRAGNTAWHLAANEPIAQLLLARKLACTATNADGETPLHRAALRGVAGVVALLLAQGADVNALDQQHNTPLHLAANEAIARALVEKGARVEAKNTAGETPLFYAVAHGRDEVVTYLLAQHADPTVAEASGATLLHYVRGPKLATLLLEQYKLAVTTVDGNRQTPLHRAAANNLAEVAAVLLRHGANAKATDARKNTPLHLTTDVATAKLLLAAGAPVNAVNAEGQTPLHLAAGGNATGLRIQFTQVDLTPLVALLLQQPGIDVNARDAKGQTPLHLATTGGVARALLAARAQPNAWNTAGETPLHLAARAWRDDVALALLDGKADPNIRARDPQQPTIPGYTPLFELTSDKVIDALLARGAKPAATFGPSRVTPLHYFAQQGYLPGVETLLRCRVDSNLRDGNGATPLHWAVAAVTPALLKRDPEAGQRFRAVIEALLARGAQVNARDKVGHTPLFMAGDPAIAALLLAKRADPNATDNAGVSVLLVKVRQGQSPELVKTLLQHGADPNRHGAKQYPPLCEAPTSAMVTLLLAHGAKLTVSGGPLDLTPLRAAAVMGDADRIALLLAKGADVNLAGANGLTPLHYAVGKDKLAAVKALLARGARVNARDKAGRTPLFMALSPAVAIALLDKGADVNAQLPNGLTAVAVVPSDAIAAVLLARKANVNLPTREGYTPLFLVPTARARLLLRHGARVDVKAGPYKLTALHLAAVQGDVARIKLLLDAGLGVDVRDTYDRTPLLVAVENNRLEAARALLARGANVNAVTKTGWNALAIANKSAQTAMIKLLVAKGAKLPATLLAPPAGKK